MKMNPCIVVAVLNFFSVFNSRVTRVSPYVSVIITQQLGRLTDITRIGRCHFQCMNQTAVCVHTRMAFHAKIPLIALFRRVHLRVPLLFLILCGTGRGNNRCVYYRSAPKQMSIPLQYLIQFIKHRLSQFMFFQQMAEFQQCRRVRYALIQKVDSHKLTHGIAVINCILYAFIGQIEPYLQQIHPQHDLNPSWRTAAFAFGIKRSDS